MDLENKKLQVDILGKETDIIKARVEIIRQKLLVFLGASAGSFFYTVEFSNSESGLIPLSILFFIVFVYLAIGTVASLIKLIKIEIELKTLQEEIKDVRNR
jgi:TRAP-type mannitol/chloroaromatic compound transport system permease small subunit